MRDETDIDRSDAVQGLFALIAARLEDAQGPSINGQAQGSGRTEMLAELNKIASCCNEIAMLDKAIRLLLDCERDNI